ncbi:hypothetical protein GCM10007890_36990 [Methylobacterium tardum]|uniref:Uncharacterized protein n=1 Tax=Methylobacterium tardum TaxID=374432 RepID=A0AA37TLB5_9HYPH|nr:hypothetical protein GCM10007890_36990 [Methylobacterium tardum]
MQVAEVAGYQEGHDLASAIGQNLVAAGDAFHDEMHVLWPLTFGDDVAMGSDAAGPTGEIV